MAGMPVYILPYGLNTMGIGDGFQSFQSRPDEPGSVESQEEADHWHRRPFAWL